MSVTTPPQGARHVIDRAVYPFESRWLALDAGRMHYLDEGEGETIVFVHGTPTWSFEWRHLIRALRPSYRCIAPDLLGFGLSERPRAFAYTPEAHAQVLEAFIERLQPEPFTLVVHDFGGPIGLPLCLKAPERVTRLVLINTWLWSFEDDPAMARTAKLAGSGLGRALYRWANFSLRVLAPSAYGDRRKLTPDIHRHYLERFLDPWSREAVLWALARSLLGSSRYYDGLWQQRETLRGRPALIVWGMKDAAFRPKLLARWREALPEAKVVELEGVGHWPHEEAPERVVEEVVGFLARK